MKYLYSFLAVFFIQISFAQDITFRIAFEPNSKVRHQVDDLLTNYNAQTTYSFAFTEERLQEMEKQAVKIRGSAESIQNIRNTFDIQIHNLTNEEEIELLRQLQNFPGVRYCEKVTQKIIPPPYDIAPGTPDYTDSQIYIYENPGVNMEYAWNLGYTGQNIKIKNIEFGFNSSHEEFNDSPHIRFAEDYTPVSYEDYWEHGTGTFGVIAGHNGEYGVTGLAHDIEEAVLFSEYTQEYGYNRVQAISLAIQNSAPGEIIIYELQTGGAGWTEEDPKYVTAEYEYSVWDLTKAATDTGIIIVAAAGNGNQNLDAPQYANYMQRGHSGAIIVGAGSPDLQHSRAYFSTYGSRVDLQGWGWNVLSTGYGDFAKIGNDMNQAYTMFSGTSSATPIVASCAAVLQSYYFDHTGEYLTGTQIADILKDSGIPQSTGDNGNIGPLPNMEAAMAIALSNENTPIQKRFRIYPNPFENQVYIETVSSSEPAKMRLFDISGKLIDQRHFTEKTELNTAHLSAGIYFMKIISQNKTETFKLVKSN